RDGHQKSAAGEIDIQLREIKARAALPASTMDDEHRGPTGLGARPIEIHFQQDAAPRLERDEIGQVGQGGIGSKEAADVERRLDRGTFQVECTLELSGESRGNTDSPDQW